MLDYFKNKLFYSDKYQINSEAMIISCFYNPQKSPYRLKAFKVFYDSIKHMNHRIIECVIGDAEPQLVESENIIRIHTENLLWHKETLLNKIVYNLPDKYKYIFWVDADVIFTNKNWLTEGVKQLKTNNIVQPFEYCVHLEQDQLEPNFDLEFQKNHLNTLRHPSLWRSFCANYVTTNLADNQNYDKHGHVGFAWGARREVLTKVPLYDKALIGGADHIIAHAAAGHINHLCIAKSFTDNIDEVNDWSRKFYREVKGKIGYVSGDLYHIWHGDIKNRDYLKRIQDFTAKTKDIVSRDKNGLYVINKEDEKFVKEYFKKREVTHATKSSSDVFNSQDDGFFTSVALGYLTNNGILGGAMGGNMAGGLIGDMLNTTDDYQKSNDFKDDSSNYQHTNEVNTTTETNVVESHHDHVIFDDNAAHVQDTVQVDTNHDLGSTFS